MNEDQNKKEELLPKPLIEEFIKRYELDRLRLDFIERTILLVIAGLGLITSLAWDEFFKILFSKIFGHLSSIQETFLYAFFLTLFTTFVSIWLTKIYKKKLNNK